MEGEEEFLPEEAVGGDLPIPTQVPPTVMDTFNQADARKRHRPFGVVTVAAEDPTIIVEGHQGDVPEEGVFCQISPSDRASPIYL